MLVRFFGLALLWALLGLPIALFVTHGIDPAKWPSGVTTPADWLWRIQNFKFDLIYTDYQSMFDGNYDGLASGANTVQFETTDLVKGTYIIAVQQGAKRVGTGRFIKLN